MQRLQSVLGRALALAAVLGATASTSSTPVATFAAPADRAAPTVTAADVDASNAKVRVAYGALRTMWSDRFAQIGAEFQTPALVRFRGGVRTSCGVVTSNNAAYCPRDNRIYFDDVFVAGQAKAAGSALGTDGDMAGLGVIAHEMGHAVAMQLGHVSRYTYGNESVADCLAGAFAQQAQQDGSLEPGDVDEALYAMSRAGDPTPRLTGDERTDRMLMLRASLMGHGTEAQRTQNFRTGLEGGAGACLAQFR